MTPAEWRQLYADCTTHELEGLRDKFLTELIHPESSWKGWYYIIGLLAAMGGVYLTIVGGIFGFPAVLLLMGLPAVWLWRKDDQKRQSLDQAYKAVLAELKDR